MDSVVEATQRKPTNIEVLHESPYFKTTSLDTENYLEDWSTVQ